MQDKIVKIIAVLLFLLCVALVANIGSGAVAVYTMWQERVEKIEYRLDSMQTRIDGLAYQEVKE